MSNTNTPGPLPLDLFEALVMKEVDAAMKDVTFMALNAYLDRLVAAPPEEHPPMVIAQAAVVGALYRHLTVDLPGDFVKRVDELAGVLFRAARGNVAEQEEELSRPLIILPRGGRFDG